MWGVYRTNAIYVKKEIWIYIKKGSRSWNDRFDIKDWKCERNAVSLRTKWRTWIFPGDLYLRDFQRLGIEGVFIIIILQCLFIGKAKGSYIGAGIIHRRDDGFYIIGKGQTCSFNIIVLRCSWKSVYTADYIYNITWRERVEIDFFLPPQPFTTLKMCRRIGFFVLVLVFFFFFLSRRIKR